MQQKKQRRFYLGLALFLPLALASGTSQATLVGPTQSYPVIDSNYGGSIVGPTSISADGRYLAFATDTALVPDDSNDKFDVYVLDRNGSTYERVSVSSSGQQGNDHSGYRYSFDRGAPVISADGRYVAFYTVADNLVPNDTNYPYWDVVVHDRVQHTTTLVSVSSSGEQANERSEFPAISADGRYIAFASWADNLIAGSNGRFHIYVRDQIAATTEIVSVASDGSQGDNQSYAPSISADGRLITFHSHASNLVTNDNNYRPDVFVHDRSSHVTELVSADNAGQVGNGYSTNPSISDDGRFVAFQSNANFLPGYVPSGIYVRDRQNASMERVSANNLEEDLGGDYPPRISGNGRFVSFFSTADYFNPGIYVHDRHSKATVKAGESYYPSSVLNGDGSLVVYTNQGNLVANTLTPTQATDILVTQSANPSPVRIGNALTYTLTVTNQGSETAHNVMFRDDIDYQFVDYSSLYNGAASYSSSQGDCTFYGYIQCALGDLQPGLSATITLTVTPTNTVGVMTNSASVTANNSDTDIANNRSSLETSVYGTADLALTMTSSHEVYKNDDLKNGIPLALTITVTNQGPDMASGVNVTSVLPGSLRFAYSYNCYVSDYTRNQVSCNTGSIASGASAMVTIYAYPTISRGDISASATVASPLSDPVLGNNSAAVAVRIR